MSNGTLRTNRARTRSGRNSRTTGLVVTVVVLLVAVGAGLFYYFTAFHTGAGTAQTATLKFGSSKTASFTMEVVSDAASQSQGLSGRSGLAAQHGMLFRYGTTGQRCIWMKDMKFNIDIIWLDASRRVVSLVQNVSPATYPHTYCADSQDVAELPAGAARQNGIRIGQIVDL